MAHDHVYGICESKCLVEVAPKTSVDTLQTDVSGKVSKSGDTMTGMLTSEYSYIPFRIRHTGLEKGVILSYIRDIQLVDKNNAEMGTMRFGGDSTGIGYIDLIARNYQGTASHCKFHVEPDGSSYLWTPSWSVGTNDNSDKVMTIKMANSLPSLVHTTGTETISGNKHFTNNIYFKSTQDVSATRASDTWFNNQYRFVAKKGSADHNVSRVQPMLRADGSNELHIAISDNDGAESGLVLSSKKYVTAPTTPSGATGTEIVTANWALSKFPEKIADITAQTTYLGSATKVPMIKYDSQGRITGATTATIYPPTTVGTSGQVWTSDGAGTGKWRNMITYGTGEPSGGEAGDIYIKY